MSHEPYRTLKIYEYCSVRNQTDTFCAQVRKVGEAGVPRNDSTVFAYYEAALSFTLEVVTLSGRPHFYLHFLPKKA